MAKKRIPRGLWNSMVTVRDMINDGIIPGGMVVLYDNHNDLHQLLGGNIPAETKAEQALECLVKAARRFCCKEVTQVAFVLPITIEGAAYCVVWYQRRNTLRKWMVVGSFDDDPPKFNGWCTSEPEEIAENSIEGALYSVPTNIFAANYPEEFN